MMGAGILRPELPKRRVSAAAVAASEHLRRADDRAELEDAWFAHCERFRHGSSDRLALMTVYRQQLDRFARNEQALKLARAI